MTQTSQNAKFRWTENLTCRFIRLRKENRKLFTGRKYSAQAGWEYILQQMREEFPTIMANVHYRVLKKKWSNLLQQYKPLVLSPSICHSDLLKELKNPVHGDRNKADDVSWPFYNAIDEVLGNDRGITPITDEYIDPHEFLCVSVTSEEPTSSVDVLPVSTDPEIERRTNHSFPEGSVRTFGADCEIKFRGRGSSGVVRRTVNENSIGRKRESRVLRLPRSTELTIEKVTSEMNCNRDLSMARGKIVDLIRGKEETANVRTEGGERLKKSRRTRVASCRENWESRIDRRIEQIFDYIKRRDEENRSIMIRVLHAVESINNKL